MKDIQIENRIPEYIKALCRRFYDAGEDVYVVGGSLRDIMLDRAPDDFDLTTSATPRRVSELFSDMRVIETGIKHGTVTVIADGRPVEITTFRVDGSYTDSRHPDGVRFTGRIEEDLARRDLTVNAMAYNDRSGLVDPFGGRDDLRAGLLRAVGDSRRRFSEDALRIMRTFRFSAQLGFTIEDGTLAGAIQCMDGLSVIARERIAVEFLKLLRSDSPEGVLKLMIKISALPYITGDFIPKNEVLGLLSQMPSEDGARLGLFLSGADADTARGVLRSLKYSNAQITGALAVLRGSEISILTPADARRLIGDCGVYAKDGAMASVLLGNSPPEAVSWVIGNTAPCTLRELAVSGRELIAVGIEGREVGKTLDRLLSAVIADPELNTKEKLLALARKE